MFLGKAGSRGFSGHPPPTANPGFREVEHSGPRSWVEYVYRILLPPEVSPSLQSRGFLSDANPGDGENGKGNSGSNVLGPGKQVLSAEL